MITKQTQFSYNLIFETNESFFLWLVTFLKQRRWRFLITWILFVLQAEFMNEEMLESEQEKQVFFYCIRWGDKVRKRREGRKEAARFVVSVLSDFGAKRYSKDTSFISKKIPLRYPTEVKKIPFPRYKYLLFNVPCA